MALLKCCQSKSIKGGIRLQSCIIRIRDGDYYYSGEDYYYSRGDYYVCIAIN